MNGRPGFEKICTFATACAILQLQEMVSRGICKIQKLLYAGNLRSCKAENSSKNNLNNKSVRFGHFSTYIKNNLGRAISFVYNDFTDTVSAGPKGGRLKETKCQGIIKTPGTGRRRDHEDRSTVFRRGTTEMVRR